MVLDQIRLRISGRVLDQERLHELSRDAYWTVRRISAAASPVGREDIIESDDRNAWFRIDSFGSIHARINLARLLHGDRATVLRNQGELDEAFERFVRLLDLFSRRISSDTKETVRLTYAEIGWNFPISYHALEAKLVGCRHPWVRKRYLLQPGVMWKLPGLEFELKAYNKTALLEREMDLLPILNGKPQVCTRVEIKLSKRKLHAELEQIGCDEFPTFGQFQSIMRRALELIERHPVHVVRSEAFALARIIAQLHCQDVKVADMSPIEFIARDMSDARARRLRRRVQGMVAELSGFSLRDLLGPDGTWPDAQELH